MKYYYEDRAKIYKIKAKRHEKVLLYNINFNKHIKIKHPEMTLKKIQNILEEPDCIYTPSRNSTVYYYERQLKDGIYRVVVNKYKRKNTKQVVTGYKVDLENDMDYFYEIFNIAE